MHFSALILYISTTAYSTLKYTCVILQKPIDYGRGTMGDSAKLFGLQEIGQPAPKETQLVLTGFEGIPPPPHSTSTELEEPVLPINFGQSPLELT